MRIRKRQVPLPFSSISPVPISSDPNFNRSPVVQFPLHQHPPLPPPCFDPQFPSDHANHPIGRHLATQSHDSSAASLGTTTTTHVEELKKKQDYLVLMQDEAAGGGKEERGGVGEKSNDTRKKSVLGAHLGNGSLSQSTSSRQAVGTESLGEGEKAFPFKKRRGSLERRGNDDNDDDSIMEKDDDNNKKVMMNMNTKKMITKNKMNKKSVQQQNDMDQQEEKESKDGTASTLTSDNNNNNNNNNNNPSMAKKRGRGGVLMEGSRCSRVNGRGWRCCQQTLVGYSLCEHHLGKGRLRSMTSVRSRSLSGTNNNAPKKEQQPSHDNQTLSHESSPSQQIKQTKRELVGEASENGDHEPLQDHKPLMMTTKKRVKLGMVKARSISSLLGQNDGAITITDDHSN